MALSPPQDRATAKIRISQIGGRYLLFDIDDIMRIRREHSICAVLVGTTPQAPNQNVFSGLPLELKPNEALLLVEKGVAFIEDDCATHLNRLRDPEARKVYVEGLKKQRMAIKALLDEENAERRKVSEMHQAKTAKQGKRKDRKKGTSEDRPAKEELTAEATGPDAAEEDLFAAAPPVKASTPATHATPKPAPNPFFTPTTSALLLDNPSSSSTTREAPPRPASAALHAHLNTRGYYMTPGIRFGGQFSAYPGDPFRYHAHFMASSYGWDEGIPTLDIVGVGRLATGVKKGFVFGGEALGDEGEGMGEESVRAFTLEWAGF